MAFNIVYRVVMIENVSGDVVGCARAKGVLDVSVRPRWHGRGYTDMRVRERAHRERAQTERENTHREHKQRSHPEITHTEHRETTDATARPKTTDGDTKSATPP